MILVQIPFVRGPLVGQHTGTIPAGHVLRDDGIEEEPRAEKDVARVGRVESRKGGELTDLPRVVVVQEGVNVSGVFGGTGELGWRRLQRPRFEGAFWSEGGDGEEHVHDVILCAVEFEQGPETMAAFVTEFRVFDGWSDGCDGRINGVDQARKLVTAVFDVVSAKSCRAVCVV